MPTCFVIQGFGKKQDYAQGKVFNLDASYAVIKHAITSAGIECVRADELSRNALIDKEMFAQLLEADLVVADITTLNFNAAYELGVRHALRPRSTLIIGEKGMNFPFDINRVYIHTYQHLGEDIGFAEANRFAQYLKEKAEQALAHPKDDSPVYEFLDHLPRQGFMPVQKSKVFRDAVPSGPNSTDSLKAIKDEAAACMQNSDFKRAIPLWKQARALAGKDDYIVQQLALATYKSKQPNEPTALQQAEDILEYLQPHRSFDTETLGLWGSVHKRLYHYTRDMLDLDEAIFALERGFFIKQDSYNGINLSFLFDLKASIVQEPQRSELHAIARHVRRKVKAQCVEVIEEELLPADDENKYWLFATLYQTCVGLGEEAEAQDWKTKGDALSVAQWQVDSTEEQIELLRKLLE